MEKQIPQKRTVQSKSFGKRLGDFFFEGGIFARLLILGPLLFIAIKTINWFNPDPQLILYVYQPDSDISVRVNGKFLRDKKISERSGAYQNTYDFSRTKPPYLIEIIKGQQVLWEDDVGAGRFVINATEDRWISAETISYSSSLSSYRAGPPAQFLGKKPLGVYELNNGSEIRRVFAFDEDPPESLSVNSNSSYRTEAVNLSAGYF